MPIKPELDTMDFSSLQDRMQASQHGQEMFAYAIELAAEVPRSYAEQFGSNRMGKSIPRRANRDIQRQHEHGGQHPPSHGVKAMTEYVQVRVEAVDWLKKHYPALCEKSGLCERVSGRLYTRSALDSAMVAQQPAERPNGVTIAWRALDGHGLPQTEWVDGDPGEDMKSAWIGGSIERAYAAPTQSTQQLDARVQPTEWGPMPDAGTESDAQQPDARTAPGHTDLMVSPESIEAYFQDNPYPEAQQPDAGEPVAWKWKRPPDRHWHLVGHWDAIEADTAKEMERTNWEVVRLYAVPPPQVAQSDEREGLSDPSDLRAILSKMIQEHNLGDISIPTIRLARAPLAAKGTK